LHRAFKQALRWGLVTRNVAEAVDLPKVHKKEVTPLSPVQARAFLEAARRDRLEDEASPKIQVVLATP
jgi:integrase